MVSDVGEAPETILPGFVRLLDDDIRTRADALGEGDAVPSQWTPEHVGARLVEAFEILSRSGGRVGPRQHANGWPAMVHEFADLVDAQARMLAEKEKAQARAARPSSDEVSRMNEALRWPMDHLDGRPLAADSLMLWAYATATGRDMAGMLHHRKKRAAALADEMMRRINALPHGSGENGAGDCRSLAMQWRAELRRQIAVEVAAWANGKISGLKRGDGDAANAVRLAARARFHERCKALNCLPIRIRPHEAVPGRAMSRTNLDRQRKVAMEIVAQALRRGGVAVR